MDTNDEAYNELMDDLREICEDYEDDLHTWEIEDALNVVKRNYQ